MRSVTLWLAALFGLAWGFAWARRVEDTTAHWIATMVITTWVAAVLAATWAWLRVGSRALALEIALVLLAAARGLEAGHHAREAQWVLAHRSGPSGQPTGVFRFEVLDASWPGARCQVRARADGSNESVWLELPPEACPLAEGAELAVPADGLHFRRDARWPGDGDPRDLALARGAQWTADVDQAWPTGPATSPYWQTIARMRQYAWDHTRGDNATAFVVSSLFGVRGAISPEHRRHLAAAGLGHLIAVSGMQVSLVAWFVYWGLLKLLGPRRGALWIALVCSLVPVLAYVGLCGAEAPCVRAAIMVFGVGLAASIGRLAHGLTVLLWTSVLMLALRPAWVFDVGFQLSVVAMAALVRGPSNASLVLQSWRVSWAIMPILIVQFGETGAWAVAANFVAVPVFSLWITPLGVLGTLLVPWLGPAAWAPAAWGAQLVLDVAALFAALPGVASVATASAATLALAARPWKHRWGGPAHAWWPSSLVCIATVLAWWVHGHPDRRDLPAADWFARGGRVHATVIAPRPGTAVQACIQDPGLPESAWAPLLHALGFESVAALELSRDAWAHRSAFDPRAMGEGDEPAPDAPHVAAIRAALQQSRLWDPRSGCRFPEGKAVRAAVKRCRLRSGMSPVFVAVRGAQTLCLMGGRWVSIGRDEVDDISWSTSSPLAW